MIYASYSAYMRKFYGKHHCSFGNIEFIACILKCVIPLRILGSHRTYFPLIFCAIWNFWISLDPKCTFHSYKRTINHFRVKSSILRLHKPRSSHAANYSQYDTYFILILISNLFFSFFHEIFYCMLYYLLFCVNFILKFYVFFFMKSCHLFEKKGGSHCNLFQSPPRRVQCLDDCWLVKNVNIFTLLIENMYWIVSMCLLIPAIIIIFYLN